MLQEQRWHRVRWIAFAWAACLGACHGKPQQPEAFGPPVVVRVTAASLDSLPSIAAHDGTLICQADGSSPCPVALATANWMTDTQFATWEPHRPVQVWSPGKTDPLTIGDVGGADGQYMLAVSVAYIDHDYVVIDAQRAQALHYNSKGQFTSALPIPPVSNLRAVGYTGAIALMQRILMLPGDSAASFQVRELDTPGDTAGHIVLDLQLGWLRLRDGRPAVGLPLFPALPSYAILPDSDIVWSPGDSFTVQRQSKTGTARWTLESGITGPPITADEINQMRARYQASPDTMAMRSFDSSLAHTGKYHPAITGLVAARDGRMLVGGTLLPSRDSVEFYLIGDRGQPQARLTLPRAYHVLLYAGDSVLVQRPEPNMQQEMRWIVTKQQP